LSELGSIAVPAAVYQGSLRGSGSRKSSMDDRPAQDGTNVIGVGRFTSTETPPAETGYFKRRSGSIAVPAAVYQGSLRGSGSRKSSMDDRSGSGWDKRYRGGKIYLDRNPSG